MLYAAGYGTRMKALTAHQPKPMIRVAGRPLIDHALDQITAYGVPNIVVNLHYKPQALEAHLAGSGVRFSHESPDILETGGGLRAALPLLGQGPVFTMNSDAVWHGPNPLDQLAKLWQPDLMDALLLCIPPENALGHTGPGDFIVNADGTARRGAGLVYSGLQIIKTDLLQGIPEARFSLNILWDMMLANHRLHAARYAGKWCDVGRPESIPLAEALLEARDV
jgi:MurNAc alpha-1-phosphate uridylyltransferase